MLCFSLFVNQLRLADIPRPRDAHASKNRKHCIMVVLTCCGLHRHTILQHDPARLIKSIYLYHIF